MQPSILSVLPPLLVLTLGIVTQRILFSMLCGIALASAIATSFSPLSAIKLFAIRLWETADISALFSWQSFSNSTTLLLFLFLSMIGMIIYLLEYTHSTDAYAHFVEKRVKTPRQGELTTALFSLLLFTDDYFSTLTVGAVMQSLTDKLKIPRAKLAYLLDSMAAPIAMLVPISSWVACITGPLSKAGVSTQASASQSIISEPFIVYVQSLPYMLYSPVVISAVFYIIIKRVSFGPMRAHELTAATTGNLFGGQTPQTRTLARRETNIKPRLSDFAFPVGIFIFGTFTSLLITGSYSLFGGSHSFLEALRNTNSSQALALGGFIAVLMSSLYFIMRKKITVSCLPTIAISGIRLMQSTMLILLCSWTLSSVLSDDLQTGVYLAQSLTDIIWLPLMPFLLFLFSATASLAIGSSWGTIAVMIPIAIPMLLSIGGLDQAVTVDALPLLLPCIGAILSGSIWGDNVSPISDTTIMSSSSSGSYHIHHVYTQFIYSLPVFASTGVGFIIHGFLAPYDQWLSIVVSTSVSIAGTILMLTLLDKGHPEKKGQHDS